MFDRSFFASKLGFAALVSIAAMSAFNVFALTQQIGMTPHAAMVAAPLVQLA
ncbi:hypothetical protein FHS61_001614 [Altererythrobacter atlanticus]|uniref:Uncharacterized protein n=1 Tax=Croceibacterium atlanticum TaxID=1267766 RepID=A0A0F7KQK5_9SPHN|nr:hypothetical protein [Croceibacterium atlanticum]AKH41090.1 hypothetical protein WYH_00023 [Croceibacterium atlanticum]MBB5732605.1 hypothetical protein [Croceibacterium atlanticum]